MSQCAAQTNTLDYKAYGRCLLTRTFFPSPRTVVEALPLPTALLPLHGNMPISTTPNPLGHLKNNTADWWWKDPGMRKLAAPMLLGFLGAMQTGEQILPFSQTSKTRG